MTERFEVSVIENADGSDSISIGMMGSAECSGVALTPAQARMLAMELIQAVNRAEVKVTLKSGANFWRSSEQSNRSYMIAG